MTRLAFLAILVGIGWPGGPLNLDGGAAGAAEPLSIRFATYNVAFHRKKPEMLARELVLGTSEPAQRVAEILQRVRPDVVLLNEFDHDPNGVGLAAFRKQYLAVSQNGQSPIEYPYSVARMVNTGVPSGRDLDKDGTNDGPADAWGYGAFPGQYGMAVLSKYPIAEERVRTFRKFLWKDMPQAKLPTTLAGQPFYSSEDVAILRLSSKSHWDVPVTIADQTVHFLVSHPTPPVFDGPEDRNGCRNHDEIRFWGDYVAPQRAAYIYDDQGREGGLGEGEHFVIAGDLNADPHDGDSRDAPIQLLLTHPSIHPTAPESAGGVAASERDAGANRTHRGPAAQDTGDFNDSATGNLRVDYVLPSRTLPVVASGVFWPRPDEPGGEAITVSDHRLVWIDIKK